MKTTSLNGKWAAKCIFENGEVFDFEGCVPSSTVNDLINADKLPRDIFWRDNTDAVAKYERCDYVYEREFQFTGAIERTNLVFERLDTYCDVYLNGKHLGRRENGNVEQVFAVAGAMNEGKNVLTVKLYSPVKSVDGRPLFEGAFTKERMNTRRTQCTYGWDWVARYVSCGIGECTLVTEEENELIAESVYIATLDADADSATVRVDVSYKDGFWGRVVDYVIYGPDGNTVKKVSRYCGEAFVRTDFDIPNAKLWYPIGYGEQPLYTLVISDGEKEIYREKFGIRTVKIMQLPDEKGSPYYEKCLEVQNKDYDKNEEFSGFVLKVNGVTVNCKGANWVPCVPFACGDISTRQTEILETSAEIGVNMIRVWGGGAFETKHFYSECSRLGIMVTQDFLMACGTYPEKESWFIEELKKEALYASLLIRNQPCLMWWTGDNENATLGSDKDEDYRGRSSAYEGIAPVLYQTDPNRRFLPSSPYGGNMYASNTVGTTHNTMFLGGIIFPAIMDTDLKNYKDEFKRLRARFIAEEAQGGAISLYSLKKFMTDEDIYGENMDMWLYHTKGNPDLEIELINYMTTFAEKVLGKFKDGKDKLFKYRYSQCEWIRVLFEQERREKGFCNGIIFWMLNDCWPAASGWSVIDYYGRLKPSAYTFKRCAKKLITCIDKEDGKFNIYAVNDGLSDEKVSLSVKIVEADGVTVREVAKINGVAEAEKSSVLLNLDESLADGEIMIADIGSDRAYYKNGSLDICPASVDFSVDTENSTVTVSADRYIQAVIIEGYAVLEDNCFTLMPGETKTVKYRLEKGEKSPCFAVEAYTLEI